MATEIHSSAATSVETFTAPVGHRISWGGIIAGVALFITLSWLLLLLGSAIGVGIADATDLGAIGDGLGIASTIWILLSTLVATFAGGLLAAKLSGTANDRIGALHGLTVWSVGTLFIILLGASGIGGTVNAVSGVLGSANKVSTTVIQTASGNQTGSMLPEAVSTSIAAVIKRQASKVLSGTAAGENNPKQSEVRSAIESLNAEDAGAITSALVAGNTEKARSELSDRTTLSNSQIDSIIQGAEEKAQDWSNSKQAEEAQQWLTTQIDDLKDSVSQSVSEMAGSEVSSQQISQTLEQLNSETILQTGQYLVMGKPEMAKDVLAVNTNLSEADIEAIVNGAEKETKQLISKAKAQLNEATETMGTYTQAVLWAAFIASALGLIAGLVGGHLGAGAVRRIYAVR